MITNVQLCARKVGKYSSYQRFIFSTVTLTLVFKTPCEHHVCNYSIQLATYIFSLIQGLKDWTLLLAIVVFLIVDVVLLSIFTSIPATRLTAQLESVRI